jgi:hypothetical protein
MIYEGILSSSHPDLKFFYDLTEEKDIGKLIGELNKLYKYDKETWINNRKVSKL